MPVTGVVGDDVDDDLDAVRVQIGDEVIKVIEGPEDWIDVAQVDDVVSTVNESGWVEGAEPHGVDPELDKVIDVVADTGQVANSVTTAGTSHLLLPRAPSLLVQFDLAMLTHDSAVTSQNILSPDLSQARTIMVSTLTKEPA